MHRTGFRRYQRSYRRAVYHQGFEASEKEKDQKGNQNPSESRRRTQHHYTFGRRSRPNIQGPEFNH